MPSNHFDNEPHPPGFSSEDLMAMNSQMDAEWAYMFKDKPMGNQPVVARLADKVRKAYYEAWFQRHRDEWVLGAWHALVDWYVLGKR